MAKLAPAVIDIETWWSQTHTLTKMSPIAYCMHPETELISMSWKINGGETQVVFGEDNIHRWAQSVDWSDKLLIAHNGSGFDFMLTAWRLGIKPAMYADTLAMSRPIHAKEAGGSLAALVKHYNLGVKDQTALINTKGRHLKDFTPDEIAAMAEYNKADVDQCWGLFKKLLPLTSKDEMRLIDMTVRMLVEPKFEVDHKLLEDTLADERKRKHEMLLDLSKTLGLDTFASDEDAAANVAKTLGSAAKFSKLLTDLGVDVPTKISPTTGKTAPALAKTDEAFLALQEHDNPIVAAAAMARLGVKSTLLETRIEKFLEAADACGGKLPIPTKYYGADTTGRRAGFLFNPLNLPRVSGKPSDALRNCMKAPPGHKIVVADLSGIELRVNHFLWQVPSSMEMYRADPEKADLYKVFASALYGIDVTEVTKAQRQVGKLAHLGLGYGAGAATFQKVAKIMGGVTLSDDEASDIVVKWRTMYKEIAAGWKKCHASLTSIYLGEEVPIDPWELCWTCKEGFRLPSGRLIRYPNLRSEVKADGKTEWVYAEGRNKARIYAGKCTENIVQALSRDVICGHALEVKRATGYNPVMEVYDELVYVVPEDKAVDHLATIQSIMRASPTWFPELVLWSEGDIADTYGAAK